MAWRADMYICAYSGSFIKMVGTSSEYYSEAVARFRSRCEGLSHDIPCHIVSKFQVARIYNLQYRGTDSERGLQRGQPAAIAPASH
jgi:hypothetical protein